MVYGIVKSKTKKNYIKNRIKNFVVMFLVIFFKELLFIDNKVLHIYYIYILD